MMNCLRHLVFGVFVLVCGVLMPAARLQAQTDIYVKGSGRLFPIALPQLCLARGNTTANKEIPAVLSRDLQLSGYFEVLGENTYVETPGKCVEPDQIAFSDWTVIGAEGLVRGTLEEEGGLVRARLYLLDVQRQRVVLGKEYSGDASQIRLMGHRFANEIMKFFTGEYGPFGTQIAFVSKVGRFKELFVMDADGSNVRQLTSDKSLSISPSWDPSGRQLVYTSYRFRMPDLFLVDVLSRRQVQVTRGSMMELGANFSRDGTRILASLTNGFTSELSVLALDGKVIKRISSSTSAIDVSGQWSPDNSKIAFVSNRGGGPQVYVMEANGSAPRRISFVSSNYCTSPAWSPKGNKIAFVCRADAGFQMFVSAIDGQEALQLTSVGSNEDPSWSPDGRYLTFATTFGKGSAYGIAMIREDGSNLQQLTASRLGDYQPRWGPY